MSTYPREFLIVRDEAGALLGASVIDHDTVRDKLLLPRPLTASELEAFLPASAAIIAQVSQLQAELTAANAAKAAAETAKGAAEARANDLQARVAELESAATAPGCTDIQGRLALKGAGLLMQVENYVAGLSVDTPERIYWDRATYWREDSPIIAGFAQLLGINDAQKAALFVAARAIQV